MWTEKPVCNISVLIGFPSGQQVNLVVASGSWQLFNKVGREVRSWKWNMRKSKELELEVIPGRQFGNNFQNLSQLSAGASGMKNFSSTPTTTTTRARDEKCKSVQEILIFKPVFRGSIFQFRRNLLE